MAVRGEFLGVGGALEIAQGDMKIMAGAVTPGVGPGWKGGVGVRMGHTGSFMTSYGALMGMGGYGAFDEKYGQGGKPWPIEIVSGQWVNGSWMSGYEVLRRREWLRAYANEGYPYPQEVQ